MSFRLIVTFLYLGVAVIIQTLPTENAESENQIDGLLLIFTLTFLQPSAYVLKRYGVTMATAAVSGADVVYYGNYK